MSYRLTRKADVTVTVLRGTRVVKRFVRNGTPAGRTQHITLSSTRLPRDDYRVLLRAVVVHYVPELHPDDVTVLDGIPVTTVPRTLIDLAEDLDKDDLRQAFQNALDRGLLDFNELAASRGRVEWRPSLAMLDDVIAEFTRTMEP